MSKIKEITARQIKDSKGRPTVEVTLETEKGSFVASCPSGVSTGENEALELRDEDGGVLQAIENIHKIIAPKLKGKDPQNQKELDELMIALDGTKHKSKLGGNAMLPVSIAICRAGASAHKIPLYQHISNISGNAPHMPLPSFNVIEGGAHADNELDLQEFMIMPQKKLFSENMILGSKIFNNLQELIKTTYGEVGMGDEGGFTPKISKAEQALYLLKSAIGNLEAKIAIDVAASEFYKNGKYILEGKETSRHELLDFYKDLVERFPIISIEDPFAEVDWEGFKETTKELPSTIIIGDDLTTTSIERIKEAKAKQACNGVIIKPNQIGTVWEAIEAVSLVKSYGWKVMASHRGGETMDTFIADFAVGVGADFIKAGAYTKEERVVKYNRLMEIEQELNKRV
ncbi:MAG: phosphopyruvate hydratase [Candidatus Staskawiczbacteria bacterium]|nr:phosphopyruvate hydratase [Candidatus Staskawiczbacteria bacterium]